MNYQSIEPPPELEPFIECIWLLEDSASAEEVAPEIVLPDGKTELIVHYGDDFCKLEGEGYIRQARVLMSGQLTRWIKLKPTGAIGVVSVRFKAAGAARFFDLPFDELVDQVFDLSKFEPDFAYDLERKIAGASNAEERLATLINVLRERLKVESREDIFVRQACQYITISFGAYSVQELVKLIGFSERQLERKFKKQVGITPKILSRIMRFQKFIALTKESNHLTLSQSALDCGYYDQSHFIRDFTRFSGLSPATYLNTEHEMSDHFTS